MNIQKRCYSCINKKALKMCLSVVLGAKMWSRWCREWERKHILSTWQKPIRCTCSSYWQKIVQIKCNIFGFFFLGSIMPHCRSILVQIFIVQSDYYSLRYSNYTVGTSQPCAGLTLRRYGWHPNQDFPTEIAAAPHRHNNQATCK